MNRFTLTSIALFALTACSSEAPAPAPEPEGPATDASYYYGMRLITGDGSDPIEDAAMHVENGKILRVGKKADIAPPKGAARVDMEGRTLLPLMVDLHSHIGLLKGTEFSEKNYSRESIIDDLDRFGYYGVGAVVALGSDSGDLAIQVRDESQAGKILHGARLFTAGRGITAKGGWPTQMAPLKDIPYQVGTEDEARKAVQELAAQKVDVVKLWVDDGGGRMPKLSPALYRAIIDEAHKSNLRVVAHLATLADAKALVAAGLDGIVHSIRDRQVDDALINAMKEKNTFFVATLTGHQSGFVYADKPEWVGEQAFREVYGGILATLASDTFLNNYKKAIDPAARRQFDTAMKNFKRLADAGVRIGFGTDSGTPNRYPGYFQHRELELMVEAGMTPMQAITAATKTSAEVMAIADLGTLAEGKSADFMVLSANPLEKITNSREIFTVYRAGKQIDRSGMMQRFQGQ